MAANIVGALEPELQNLVKESRILLVGSGGIGCEVLKNLVLTGFSELEVIDLDTIEVSNLNRQFLFHKESVGKPKSQVARESVLKFNPNVNILSHVGDIMDQRYGGAFFKKFKLVINALDNRKARTHVNRMCLSYSIPLIESGTTGYDGQVEVIIKGKSMCYECLPKATPKVYPMCTIRNTPKEPIHCIVWAKFLFGELFGQSDEERVSLDVNSKESSSSSEENVFKMSTRDWAINNDYDKEKLLKKIFFDDIHYMLYNMPDLYNEKAIKPVPLDESLLNQRSDYKQASDTDILDLPQNITMFLDSVDSIKEKLKISDNNLLVWDKDEDDFMNFVVSSSNIRSATFNIPLLSHFEIKSKAGNIIPAIATANAIIAGQIVIHALRILKGKIENCQSVFLRGIPNHRGAMLVKDKKLQEPRPKCNVCSTEGNIIFVTDVNNLTLRQFEDLVLKQKLNIVAPDVMVDNRIVISSDEDDELDTYKRLLSELKIREGSVFTVDDYFQSYRVKMTLYHKERENEEDPLFEIFASEDDYIKSTNGNNGLDKLEEENNDCLIEEKNNEINVSDISKIDNSHSLNKINKTELKVEEVDKEPTTLKSDVQENDVDKDVSLKRKTDDVEETTEAKKIRVDAAVENNEELIPKRKNDNEVIPESKQNCDDE